MLFIIIIIMINAHAPAAARLPFTLALSVSLLYLLMYLLVRAGILGQNRSRHKAFVENSCGKCRYLQVSLVNIPTDSCRYIHNFVVFFQINAALKDWR